MTSIARWRVGQKRRFRIFERDSFRCVYCGRSAVDGLTISVSFHEDHVFPKSLGGADIDENLVTCCADCNLGKKQKVLSVYPPAMPHAVMSYADHMKAVPVECCDVSDVRATRLPAFDREVIEILVSIPESVGLVVDGLSKSDLETDVALLVFDAAMRLSKSGRLAGLSNLLLEIDDQDAQSLLVAVDESEHTRATGDPQERVAHFAECLRRRAAERQAHAAALAIKTNRLDPEREAQLLERLLAERSAAQGHGEHEEATNGR